MAPTSTISKSLITGEHFKAARLAAGVTVADAARMIPCSRSAVQRYENQGQPVRSLTLATAIARTYKSLLKIAEAT